jgi:hypothetical protein
MNASDAVYAFTSITFTPAGASGRSGPTLPQALAYYAALGNNTWVQDPAFYDVIGNGTQVGRFCVSHDSSCMQHAR